MNFLDKDNVISQITLAILLKAGKGTPVHKNRPTHGLAYNVNHTCIYKFDNGKALEVKSGDCIYLPKTSNYTVIKCETNSNSTVYAINFNLVSEEIFEPQLFHTRGKNEFEALFNKASNAWLNKNVGFYDECFSDLYRIIKLLKKENSSYFQQATILNKLAPALKYINENFTQENIKLAHLAQICNVSEPYLRRLFHSAFSTSPALYIRNMRINYAKELIKSREYSITEIAIISGFCDVSYFSREFKKNTGMTPKDYAESNQ
ncbi:MAG: helix-turn-helix domain-containing protein [Clostridiales bacterium]|nr:helix-turn-helix domain-containing protein [Clostridiales bacterium]